MTTIQADLKYTDEHEWLSLDDDIATVGITDFAQEALGDLVFVELPEVGKQVNAGDDFVVVESVKAASEVYAPITGEVVEVNDELTDAPEKINTSPYEEGWIAKIRITNKDELENLLTADAYQQLTE